MKVVLWKRSVVLGVLLLGGAGLALAGVPPVITIPATRGDVTFQHREHQVRTRGECLQCHHEGAGVHRCGSCHDGKRARVARDVVHTMCRGCHNEKGTEATPLSCDGCHA